MKTTSRTRTTIMILSAIALLSAVSSASGLQPGSQSEPTDWKWPVSSAIPVCWYNPVASNDPRYDEEVRKMGLVKNIVNNEWARFSALSFSGWGQCGPGSEEGIQINIMWESRGDKKSNGRTNPSSYVGWENVVKIQRGGYYVDANRDDIPARPAMNLQFDAHDPYIESSGLHEFGHALGFQHEHRRTNENGELVTDFFCQELHPTQEGDQAVADGNFLSDAYDANSIMSYCPIFGEFFNAISEKDATGIQKHYGPGEEGVLLKQAVFTGKTGCGDKYPEQGGQGAAFLHVWDNSCWSCPAEYGRTLDPNVAGGGACMKGGRTLTSKATYEGPATGIFKTDCRSGQFLHGFSGRCYSCPSGYGRTLAGIDAPDACMKTEPTSYAAGTSRGNPGCAEGSFEHVLSGSCYACGDGYDRTLVVTDDPSKEPNACVRRDWGVARMVTLPWRILSFTN